MTPRERDVIRAVAKALRGNPEDMDALAMSYPVPPNYAAREVTIRQRAAMFLTMLAYQ